MKEDTRLLLTKLVDINNKRKAVNPVFLTKEGTRLIKNLFGKLHSFYNKWELNKKKIFQQIQSLSHLPKSDDYSYIPSPIRTEIESACRHMYSLSFTFQDRIFKVFLCLKADDEKYRQSLIRRIYLWLSMASEHVKPSCSKTVNIYFYLIDKKKEVPSTVNEQIDLIHVNTAFTTGCQPHTNVHIFREEEWFRAFIHESFHNLGFDFLQLDAKLQENAVNRIRAIFPVKMRDIRFNETYCEMWAEVLNVLFFVYLSDPTQSIEKMMKLFKKMLYFEGMFSTLQCVKILKHNNLLYGQLHKEEFASKYKEKTQGFSYYILKSIYMVHVNRFIHFCATQAANDSLQFSLNSKSIESYTQIIEDNYRSEKYRDGIRIMEKELAKATTTQGVFKNTLRMSLFEGTS